MKAPLDELYFAWLYGQVADHHQTNPRDTYWNLFRVLYKKEFAWFVPNDDNRAVDGMLMRQKFAESQGIFVTDEYWLRLGCSMLELLIGIAKRMAYEDEQERGHVFWFWHLMGNLRLRNYSDAFKLDEQDIDERLERIIWRTYDEDGRGGLFPLRRPNGKDQRKVEIWYQLSAYLLEHQ